MFPLEELLWSRGLCTAIETLTKTVLNLSPALFLFIERMTVMIDFPLGHYFALFWASDFGISTLKMGWVWSNLVGQDLVM